MVPVSYEEVFRMKKRVLLIVIALAITLAGWLLITPDTLFNPESHASSWVYMIVGFFMMVIPIVWIINKKEKKNLPGNKK